MLKVLLDRQLSLKHDVIITVFNSVGVVLGIFFLNGYIARAYGLDVLGEYLFIRRTSTALVGVLLLGMNIGLANYIAKDKNGNFGHNALFSFLVFTIPLLLFLLLMVNLNIVPGFNREYLGSYFLYAIGVSLQALTYSLYRGYMNMIPGNLIQFASSALIPIAVALFVGKVNHLLSTMGVFISILCITGYLYRNNGFSIQRLKWEEMKQLWRYGGERLLGFASQFLLLAGVPILVIPHVDFTELSYLNASMSLVRMFLIFVGPLGIVLLPRVSRMLAKGMALEVKRGVELLISCTLFFGTLGAVSLSFFGGEILELWLGSISDEGAWTARMILLAVPFFVTVGVLRSPIDAASPRGYNSLVFSISAMALILSFTLMKNLGVSPLKAGVMSFLTGYVTACLLSLLIIRKLLNVKPFSFVLFRDLAVGIALLSVVYLAAVNFVSCGTIQMAIFFATVVGSSLVFILISPVQWVRMLRQSIFYD